MQKWVPAFDAVITSAYRDPKKNQSVGGVGNSAHLHGLAYDWVLRDPLSGRYLSKSQAKKIFDDFVLPNWSGYALFEEGGDVPGWHYHTNLSREVTLYAGLVAATGLGVVGYKLVENWIEGKKGGSGHE